LKCNANLTFGHHWVYPHKVTTTEQLGALVSFNRNHFGKQCVSIKSRMQSVKP
jgi:hypothetical protein